MKNDLLKTNKAGVHITSRGPFIICYSGRKFYPLDIRPADIAIEDIAHALARQCRFGGHVHTAPYSVAEHCVRVCDFLEKDRKLRGLLHDASEAYLVDVPRPIKRIGDFNTYRRIEKETQDVIYAKFGLETGDGPEWIHEADNLLLATEARDLMGEPNWCKGMPKLDEKIVPWSYKKAEAKYLERFKELHG